MIIIMSVKVYAGILLSTSECVKLFRREIINQVICTDYLVNKYGSVEKADLEAEIDSVWFSELEGIETGSDLELTSYKYRANQTERERQYILGYRTNTLHLVDQMEYLEFPSYDFFTNKEKEEMLFRSTIEFLMKRGMQIKPEQYKIFIVTDPYDTI